MRFNFYLLISLIIHLAILTIISSDIKKERLKGQKITPIEIINNQIFNSSIGNTNQNSMKSIPKQIENQKNKFTKNDKKFNETKELKLKDQKKKSTENFQINKEEIIEKFEKKVDKKILKNDKKFQNNNKINKENESKIKEKRLDNSKISNPQQRGVGDKEDNKDIETGSIKGKGKLKISCLNCILPKYPRKALKKGLEGKPTVKVWILKSGDVEKAEIIISSGVLSIDKAAIEAAQKSKFHPLPLDSFLNIQYDLKLK